GFVTRVDSVLRADPRAPRAPRKNALSGGDRQRENPHIRVCTCAHPFYLRGPMGLFWDLLQQSQISQQSDRADNLQDRITNVEIGLRETRKLLREVIARLEKHVQTDLNE